MDPVVRLTSAAEARSLIAELVLGRAQTTLEIGDVSLRPHQLDAVVRLHRSLAEFGGALLCDDVGMGKTYVAAAVARSFSSVLIVAPSALRSMWMEALRSTDVRAHVVTFERLSRRAVRGSYDFLVVDEAHHVRNPATHRYRSLSALVASAKVLLMSATPIHNKDADLRSLLALFLGSRARTMTVNEISRCVVRRGNHALQSPAGIPRVAPTQVLEIGDSPDLVSDLLSLPPPLPLRDGGVGHTLIVRGLVHQWASSEAALRDGIRRRRARGYALRASLDAGSLPTARELSTWIFDDGALQLGFAELLAESVGDAQRLQSTLAQHLHALENFEDKHARRSELDARRAGLILEICARHPDSRIIAFAQYEETVRALFARVRKHARAALLTGHGATVASGRIGREEVLNQFSTTPTRRLAADRIDLLLTTDILSEGVNLQGGDVVVHLDLPWTAARLEQRVGRVARMGSRHETVSVYALRTPESARRALAAEDIVLAKWRAAREAVGTSSPQPFAAAKIPDTVAIPELSEQLRQVIQGWLREPPDIFGPHDAVRVAAVKSSGGGFLAAFEQHSGDTLLLVADDTGISASFEQLIDGARAAENPQTRVSTETLDSALERIAKWQRAVSTRELIGIGDTSVLVPRTKVTARIESMISSSPLHIRASRLASAERALDLVNRQHCASVETLLEEITEADCAPDEWLARLSALATDPPPQSSASTERREARLRALILFERD